MIRININNLYLEFIQKFQYSIIGDKIICKCGVHNKYKLPIPIKIINKVIIFEDYCCSFTCLLNFVKLNKEISNIKYFYTYNIILSIIPFLIQFTENNS
jgi:hypothetical protein